MHKVAFDGCCGITILSRFKDNYQEGIRLTEAQKTQCKEMVKDHIRGSVTVGMLISALNSRQVDDGLEEVLLECGYRDMTGPFLHPGHGNFIHIYGYEHHPQRREEPAPWDYLRKTLRKAYRDFGSGRLSDEKKPKAEAPKRKFG